MTTVTSEESSSPRVQRRTAWFVYGCWAILTVLCLGSIIRTTHNSPLIDEWEFIPALFHEEPMVPWLWKLHNEHRFPVPRLVYYPLFQLTHDFRAGCFLSLLGVSWIAFILIRLAARVRGRLHWADAFFPISLLHLGNYENLRMGYQVCFMLVLVLLGLILRAIVLAERPELLRRLVHVAGLLLLLMGCGAAGLAFGPPLALGLLVSLFLRQTTWSRIVLGVSAILVPAFIYVYFQDYQRPEFHPPSAGIVASARIALQALSTSFGVAVSGLWATPNFELLGLGFGALLTVVCFECVVRLMQTAVHRPEERGRAIGLILFLVGTAILVFGIGWGRSGFPQGNMGLAARYTWIVWPGFGAVYFVWLLYGGPVLSRRVPIALFLVSVAFLPFNMGTGVVEGENYRREGLEWSSEIRAGATDEEMIERFCPNWYPHVQERIRVGLRLMRAAGHAYYFPLREPPPQPPKQRPRNIRISKRIRQNPEPDSLAQTQTFRRYGNPDGAGGSDFSMGFSGQVGTF